MAYKITDDCVACGSCADECPNDAIISGDDKYEINADECLDCGWRISGKVIIYCLFCCFFDVVRGIEVRFTYA